MITSLSPYYTRVKVYTRLRKGAGVCHGSLNYIEKVPVRLKDSNHKSSSLLESAAVKAQVYIGKIYR